MDEDILHGGGEAPLTIIARKGSARLKFSEVSPAQWMAANARVMAELIKEGHLSSDGIMQYLGYTAKIGELATTHTWASVLSYDREYREAQSALEFVWGADSPFIHNKCLIQRASKAKAIAPGGARVAQLPGQPKPGKRGPFTPNGEEICRLYNIQSCHLGPACKRVHVCRIQGCGLPHPASEHSKNGQSN